MSETQDFNPRTFLADRRARLARFAAAAKEPAWPLQEKVSKILQADSIDQTPLPAAPKSFRCWFRMDDPAQSDRHALTIREILLTVADHFIVHPADLKGQYRGARLVRARHTAFYLCRNFTIPRKSFPEIGRQFGNRDHATILNGVRRIESLMTRDPAVRADIEILIARISGSAGTAS